MSYLWDIIQNYWKSPSTSSITTNEAQENINVPVKWFIIGSGFGMPPFCHQAITWTNADLLPTASLGMNFCENLIKIQTF